MEKSWPRYKRVTLTLPGHPPTFTQVTLGEPGANFYYVSFQNAAKCLHEKQKGLYSSRVTCRPGRVITLIQRYGDFPTWDNFLAYKKLWQANVSSHKQVFNQPDQAQLKVKISLNYELPK